MLQGHSRRLALGAALTLAAVLGPRAAPASMVLAMDLPQLASQAERIVVGEVMSVSSSWDKQHQRILSTIEIQVAEIWKGQMPGNGRITLVQPGGSADGIEMIVHGLPAFVAGERAVLFLRGRAANPPSLVGMGQGKRALDFDTTAGRWMVNGGDRSAAVNLDGKGRVAPAPAEPALPLEDMRRLIQGLVTRP